MQRWWLITSSSFLLFWLYKDNYHIICTPRKQYQEVSQIVIFMFLKALTSESFWWWLEITWKVCSRQLQWLHCNPQQWNLVWDMFLPGMDSSFFTEWKVTNVARGVNQQLKFWQHYNEKRIFSHCPGYSKSPHSSDRTLVLISQVNTQKRVSQQQQTKTSLARWP